MRKRLYWVIGSLAGVGIFILALATWFFHQSSPDFTMESFNRIQLGMTRTEVENVLGSHSGVYFSGPTELTGEEEAIGVVANEFTTRWGDASGWSGRDGQIMVVFNNDKVIGALFQGKRPLPESIFAMLRRLCRL